MLTYLKNKENVILDYDDYYIQEEWFGGDDTLVFSLPFDHPQLPDMLNQLSLTDKESGQAFLITQTDDGDITAQIDLDEFRQDMYLNWTNGSDTAAGTIRQILPTGWNVQDFSGSSIRRTITMEGATALEILKEIPDIYGLAIRFDRKTKRVLLKNPDTVAPTGAYFSDELNLRKQPVRTAQTKNFATRLYAVGKDGLTFSDINGGKSYVENNEYSDRIISAYWKDERYTVKENLLADAHKKLEEMAKPVQSYECDVVDLAKIDPEKWAYLTVEMYQGVILMDKTRNSRLIHRVARYRRYPHYPEKNIVTLSTVPSTISSKVEQSYNATTNPNSSFQQIWKGFITGLVDGIAGYDGGNLIITKNDHGKPNGLMIMDTESQETAQKILWINLKGILYSSQGMAGFENPNPEKITVWSFDKNGFYANWLVIGTIDASIVRVINLIADHVKSKSGNLLLELWAGVLSLSDGDNLRSRIYTAVPETGTLGVMQVFSGNVTEEGGMQPGARVSQMQPNLIECGSDGKGKYTGIVRTGSVQAADNMIADVTQSRIACFNAVRPNDGQNTLYTDWKRVGDLSDDDYVMVGSGIVPNASMEEVT